MGGMVDFTNPQCFDWFVAHLNERKARYGLDGFKFDAGESNFMLPDYKTHTNILRPVDWTQEYDRMIEQHFGGFNFMCLHRP